MTSGSNDNGAPGPASGASPTGPDDQRAKLRETRRRIDKVYGIGLLVIGLFATIVNMTIFTENSLAQQFAALYEQYGLTGYTRADDLATLSLVGILGHPVIYAIALYFTLIRWRRDKIGAWIPVIGALVAVVFSGVLLAVGVAMHPELVQAAATIPAPSTPAP